MFGYSSLRQLLTSVAGAVVLDADADMDVDVDVTTPAQTAGTQLPGPRPTTYYFAYGSNLHLKQMKRRCPNSRYIGRARLSNYRWQINERGYANVVDAEGHWVDGLVYEIDDKDEARLDVNEGVSKNAYTKRYLPVLLHRAHGLLYRRPTSWIVDKGGPAKVCRDNKLPTKKPEEQSWMLEVLVYISPDHILDSTPKEEYVNRINLGVVDATALGIDHDYITNCIRPFIPEQQLKPPQHAAPKPAAGLKRSASPRTGEPSPARKGQTPTGQARQTSPRTQTDKPSNCGRVAGNEASNERPPPLPPRPTNSYRGFPVIVIEEFRYS